MKVLLVEDDSTMQATLQRALARRSMAVTAMGAGHSALLRWVDVAPDVVVLDPSLPGMDGLQVQESAKSIGEQLNVRGYHGDGTLNATVPYSALEAFEADSQSHMVYRISTLEGASVWSYAALPVWQGQIPERPPSTALVDFYFDWFQGRAVRVAALLQPVSGAHGRAMAVPETLELREATARHGMAWLGMACLAWLGLAWQILWNTLLRQAALVLVMALTALLVVQHATRPVRALSRALQA